jgi:tetratricopeptide (TPR) repeat protein
LALRAHHPAFLSRVQCNTEDERKADYAFAHYKLGHCLLHLDKHAEAIEYFRSALRCKPNSADAHTSLGELLVQRGEDIEALVHIHFALTCGSRNDPRLLRVLVRLMARSIWWKL